MLRTALRRGAAALCGAGAGAGATAGASAAAASAPVPGTGELAEPPDDRVYFPPSTPVSRWPCRRVAVYGGTFDPMSHAHITCAAQLMHSGLCDEVLIVPSGDRPGARNHIEPFSHRMMMSEIAISSAFSRDFRVSVCDAEGQGGIDTYSLLKKLHEQNPGAEFHFVVGSDWLQGEKNLMSWHPRLADEYQFIVLERPGFKVPSSLPEDRFRVLKAPGADYNFIDTNLSSSEIRNRTWQGMREPRPPESGREASRTGFDRLHLIEGLVDRGVLSYIERHNLYTHLRSSRPPRATRIPGVQWESESASCVFPSPSAESMKPKRTPTAPARK